MADAWEKAFAIAATGDVVSTEIALRGDYGLGEWNPIPWAFADHTAARVGWTVVVVIGVIGISRWLKRHGGVWGRRIGKGLLILGTSVNTGLTMSNVYQMR